MKSTKHKMGTKFIDLRWAWNNFFQKIAQTFCNLRSSFPKTAKRRPTNFRQELTIAANSNFMKLKLKKPINFPKTHSFSTRRAKKYRKNLSKIRFHFDAAGWKKNSSHFFDFHRNRTKRKNCKEFSHQFHSVLCLKVWKFKKT